MRALVKVILFLLLIGLALTGGTFVGQMIMNDPGYVLISYETLTVETSLWIALAGLIFFGIVVYLTFRLIGRVLDSPLGLGRVWARLRGRSARGATQKGFMELRMGRYEAALKHLTSAAPRSELAFINYLSAAEAANALGRGDQRDDLLVQAMEAAPGSELAVGLAEARMQFENGQLQDCAATLKALRQHKPKDAELITLSCQVAEQLGDSDTLIALLPKARKLGVMDEARCEALEVSAFQASLVQAGDDAEGEETDGKEPLALKNTWDAVPKRLRATPSLARTYVDQLLRIGAHDVALTQLEGLLKRSPEDELIALYASLPGDLARKKAFLTKRGKGALHTSSLNLALGRVAIEQGDLPAAEAALEASIEDVPSAEGYEMLAELYKRQNRPDMALQAMEGLANVVRDWPGVQRLPAVDTTAESTPAETA